MDEHIIEARKEYSKLSNLVEHKQKEENVFGVERRLQDFVILTRYRKWFWKILIQMEKWIISIP